MSFIYFRIRSCTELTFWVVISLHGRLHRVNLVTYHAECAATVCKGLSEPRASPQRAGTVGCLCAETEASGSCTLLPGFRDWAGGEATLPVRKCNVTQASTTPNSCLLLCRAELLLAEQGLKGGLQKCSAHVKVCVSALSFKQGILESSIMKTLEGLFCVIF
jgi:hypothetical protein